MGGDGGCVPQRADMVKTRGYGFARGDNAGGQGYLANTILFLGEDQGVSKQESRRIRMRFCRLTNEPLQIGASSERSRDSSSNSSRIVADKLGNLYNKETILEKLLAKTLPEEYCHINKLKEVKDCRITARRVKEENTREESAETGWRLICPLSQEELDNGIKMKGFCSSWGGD